MGHYRSKKADGVWMGKTEARARSKSRTRATAKARARAKAEQEQQQRQSNPEVLRCAQDDTLNNRNKHKEQEQRAASPAMDRLLQLRPTPWQPQLQAAHQPSRSSYNLLSIYSHPPGFCLGARKAKAKAEVTSKSDPVH